MPDQKNELFERVYSDLRRLAAAKLSVERIDHTLQPTALVHEVFLKLNSVQNFEDTSHFFSTAAQAMQRILVDHAKARLAHKRGGKLKRAPLIDIEQTLNDPAEILVINDLLNGLQERSARKAELFRLRLFAGCTIPECAEILGISTSTADDDWAFAKAWLRREWAEKED